MIDLTQSQRKKLKSLAHHLKPVVYVGKLGVTESLIEATEKALADHELIKIKFVDFKDEKKGLVDEITTKTGSVLLNIIGNIAIVFRQNEDPEKRQIAV